MAIRPTQGQAPPWGSYNAGVDGMNPWLDVGHNADGTNKKGAVSVTIKVIDDATVLTTGDGKQYFFVTDDINGMNLVQVRAFVTTVSSSGLVTVQIRNVTDSFDMLTTRVTIDANEKGSNTAAAAAVIDTAHDDVTLGDQLAIDVDTAGTGARGLSITLTFN